MYYLLGEKLGHSYSPQIHRHLGEYTYKLLEKAPDQLGDFLKNGTFSGLNVTIPYKKSVIPYCDALTPIAARLGAVNTIIRQSDGSLLGHNTDYFGFETMLKRSGLQVQGKKVLVLGTGGASQTAVAVLQDHGAQVVAVSRTGENHYGNLFLHQDAAVIVNATPVGMYPHAGSAPLSLALFPQLEGVLDCIYNPTRTKLLMDADTHGIVAMNGLLMLVAQAKEGAEWFTGRKIPDERIDAIYTTLQKQMTNILLIGMPGSGKSTIGSLLARKTGKRFVDADVAFEEKVGCSPAAFLETKGEAAFRALETEVLAELGQQSGLVLATGGGCVTKEENYPHLHQNGSIFWLDRCIDSLATQGRPLSQATPLTKIYRIRAPLYARFADYKVDNNGTPEETVSNILHIWEEQL